MKSNQIKLAITAATSIAAAALSTSAMSFAYQGTDELELLGTSPTELHAYTMRTRDGIECVAGDPCDPGENTLDQVFQIPNKTVCTGVVGTSCTGYPQVADNYCSAGASSCTQDADDISGSHNPTFLVTRFYDASDNGYLDLNAISAIDEWDLRTNEKGMITSGWYLANTTLGPGVNIVGVIDFDRKIQINLRGDIANVDEDCYLAGADRAAWQACATAQGVTYSSFGNIAYMTVPMGQGGSEKAVPVPAYAAAALGLGLVGVTMLAGRRRKVQ